MAKRRRFLIVTFDFKGTAANEGKLTEALDKAIDWVQCSPTSWLLWTSSDPSRWNARLKTAIGSGVRFFIAEIVPSERSGVMPSSFWESIRSHAGPADPGANDADS